MLRHTENLQNKGHNFTANIMLVIVFFRKTHETFHFSVKWVFSLKLVVEMIMHFFSAVFTCN